MNNAKNSLINGALSTVNLQVVTRREPVPGLYERCLGEAFAGVAEPGVVDIGAHTGQFLEESRQINPKVRILAIEPQPAVFAELSQLCNKYGFQAVNTAVGETPGTLDFHVFPESQCSSLLPGAETADGLTPYLQKDLEVIQVPVRRLDDIMEEQKWQGPIDYLKIDVQGYEDRVLRGATQTLARTRHVMIELHFKEVYKGCCLVDQGCHLLREAGFHLVRTVGYLPGTRVNELVSSDFFFKRGA